MVLNQCFVYSPGEPAITVKGGTTVSGGSTALSAITQQSFNTDLLPLNDEMKIKLMNVLSFNSVNKTSNTLRQNQNIQETKKIYVNYIYSIIFEPLKYNTYNDAIFTNIYM